MTVEGARLREYIDGLKVEVELPPIAPVTVERAAELTHEVSAFTTTGVHRGADELRASVDAGERAGFLVQVRDRFGDHGLAGVVSFAVDRGAAVLCTDDFLLNCRVLGKDVEVRVLAHLAGLARAAGSTQVAFRYRALEGNALARDFLASIAPGAPLHDTTTDELRTHVVSLAAVEARVASRPAAKEQLDGGAGSEHPLRAWWRAGGPGALCDRLTRVAAELDAASLASAARADGPRVRS